MKPNIDYSLYLVTDSELMSTDTIEESVEKAIAGGCTLVQLREKNKSSLDFYSTALKVKKVCAKYRVPLFINDRVDIALAVDAEGAHVGQDDLPAAVARRLLGRDRIIGVSVSCVSEAEQAEADGADYLGVGTMFPTNTKTDGKYVSLDELKSIRSCTSLPLVVIGGINQKTIPLFANTGINGLAVVSAIVAAQDISEAAREIMELYRKTF